MPTQINLNSDPSAPGVIQIFPISDPLFPGVVQAQINSDPSTPGVVQGNINYDPRTLGLVFVNFNSTPGPSVGMGLQTLTLNANQFTVGNPQGTVVGSVLNTTPGSTVTFSSLSVAGSLQLALVGSTWQIQVGPTAPGTPGTITFNLVETKASSPNSPNTTSGFSVIENAAGVGGLQIDIGVGVGEIP